MATPRGFDLSQVTRLDDLTSYDILHPATTSYIASPPVVGSISSGVVASKTSVAPTASSVWTRHRLNGAIPSARSAHTMTVINAGSALIIFGGCGRGSALCNDMFFVDLIPSSGAAATAAAKATANGSTATATPSAAAAAFQLPSFQCVSLMPVERLERRIGHTATALASGTSANNSDNAAVLASNNVYVFGGWNGQKYHNYGCLIDVQAEELLVESYKGRKTPTGRRDHSASRLGTAIYLFGGWDCAEQYNDLWLLNSQRWSWRLLSPAGEPPSARRGHSATMIGSLMWIFGGVFGFSRYLNDVSCYDAVSNSWLVPAILNPAITTSDGTGLQHPGPAPRAWHSACRVGNTNQIIVFGGTGGRQQFYNDVWILDTQAAPPDPLKPDHKVIAWYKLNTTASPAPSLAVATGDSKQKPDTKIDDSSSYNPNLPAGRASHGAVLVGSSLVVFGGLIVNPSDSQVVPCNELFVLHTGLNIPAGATGYDSDSDPDTNGSDEDIEHGAGGDSDIDVDGVTLTKGGATSKHGHTTTRGGAHAHVRDEEQVTEGWLASHESVGGSSKVEKWEWQRCYFRLVNNELDQYEPKQKGAVALTPEGCTKIWINKRLEAESSASGEYLLQSDTALEHLLNAPATDKKLQEFLMFCKSIFSEENVSFALEVAGFKATHTGSADTAAIKADVKSIYEKYIAAGAQSEISAPLKVKFEIESALAGRSNAPAMNSSLWDSAQKHVFATIRTDIVPKFVQHLQAKREKQADLNLDKKLALKSGLTEADRSIKSCDNCMAPFSFTKSRNFCRYCGNIYCTPCVANTVQLPPEFGVNERVRVCDMCAGVLAGRPRHHAFSFVSPKRNKPLNLAAESEHLMRVWMAALNKAIANSARAQSTATTTGATAAAGTTTSGGGSPQSGPMASGADSKSAAAASGETGLSVLPNGPVQQGIITTVDGVLHLEGWLQKEDPTSKIFRRRYFILHDTTLWYYEMVLLASVPIAGARIQTMPNPESTIRKPLPAPTAATAGAGASAAGTTGGTATAGTAGATPGGYVYGSNFSYRFHVQTQQKLFKLAADSEMERHHWNTDIVRLAESKKSLAAAIAHPFGQPQQQLRVVFLQGRVSMDADSKISPAVLATSVKLLWGVLNAVASQHRALHLPDPGAHMASYVTSLFASVSTAAAAAAAKDTAAAAASAAATAFDESASLCWAFRSVPDAVYFASAVQRVLCNVIWPTQLLALPQAGQVPLPATDAAATATASAAAAAAAASSKTSDVATPTPDVAANAVNVLPSFLFAGLRVAMGVHSVAISDKALTILAGADRTESVVAPPTPLASASASSAGAAAALSMNAAQRDAAHREDKQRERDERTRKEKGRAVDALLNALRLSGLLCDAADGGQIFCTLEVSDVWHASAPKAPDLSKKFTLVGGPQQQANAGGNAPANDTPAPAATPKPGKTGSTASQTAGAAAAATAAAAANAAAALKESKEAKELRLEKEKRATVVVTTSPVTAQSFSGYPTAIIIHQIVAADLTARLPVFKPNFTAH